MLWETVKGSRVGSCRNFKERQGWIAQVGNTRKRWTSNPPRSEATRPCEISLTSITALPHCPDPQTHQHCLHESPQAATDLVKLVSPCFLLGSQFMVACYSRKQTKRISLLFFDSLAYFAKRLIFFFFFFLTQQGSLYLTGTPSSSEYSCFSSLHTGPHWPSF